MKILISMVFVLAALLPAVAQHWKAYYDSTQQYWAKDWPKTVSLLESAERDALTDLGLYNENYLTILNDLGTAYWKAKQYPKAESTLSKSLALKAEVYPAFDKELMLSISNLAGFYFEQGSWQKAQSLYRRIVDSNPAQIPVDIYVSAAQSLVSLYDMDQHPDSARLLLDRVEKLDVIADNSDLFLHHRFYRARIARKLQHYQQAEDELRRLLQLLIKRNEPEMRELYIQSLQEQGILSLETGSYSEAEKNLLRAYEMVTPNLNREFLLTELSNNLAQVYDKLNIFDKALVYYEESLGRCRVSYPEGSLPCVILQNNIAGIYLKQDNIPQAIEAYQKVIGQLEELLPAGDPLYITALNNLATAHRKNKEWNLAKQYLGKADKLIRAKGKTQDDLAATIWNNIAVLHTAQGELAQAAEYYKNAYAIKRSIYGENSLLLIDLINNLAVTYWALNRPQDAIPLFKKSTDLATRQVVYVFPNLNEREQVQFYEKLKEDFERFNAIAVQWRHRDPSLISQMFENRTVLKSVQFFTDQRRKRLIETKNDPVLNALLARLKASRNQLGHSYQLPLREIGQGADVLKLEARIDSLEKAISLRSSEALFDEQRMAQEVQWPALVAKLKPDEAIVEIVRFRKYDRQPSKKQEVFGFTDSVHYAAIILRPETTSHPDIVLFRDGNNLETRYFNYYKNSLKYGVEDAYSHQFFWGPLEKRLMGKRRIYFSSDGVYHRINLNTLRDHRDDKFLLEKYEIVYLLNPIQILDQRTKGGTTTREAVLMGDPVFDQEVSGPRERTLGVNQFVALPGTQEELRAINKVLAEHKWKTRLYVKGAATEFNLKSVTSPGILHLASHGFFSGDIVSLNQEAKKEFMFHSGIVLTGANKTLAGGSTSFHDDGIVTAFDVMNLELTNTQLVVLSACETGLGKIENGEGVFGLQRSFMQAGARNVLISLWKVDDDATKDLMIRFYEYLVKGDTIHNSLKKAQLDQARLRPDPALWGGFVLVGHN